MPTRRLIGSLQTIVFEGDPGAPAIVLFHGYGADGADLAPFAAELSLKRRWTWLFPDAPGIRRVMGMPAGRMWFPIDEAAIERAQMTGKAVDFSKSPPSGFEEARGAASRFLEASGLPWERLVLGGFSQGGILAVDLALRAPKPPLGLAVLSGNLVAEAEWRRLAPSRAGLPFFQSHGSADPILGFQGALRLESLLKEAGLVGTLHRFEGGHTVAPEAAEALAAFLDGLAERLPSRP